MREFLICSRKGATSPDFGMNNLPSKGGRMDLNARCVISALWLSREVRRDSRIILSLNGPDDPPLVIAFDGKELERVTPDERNVALWIKKTIKKKDELDRKDWLETSDGIYLSRKSFQDVVKDNEDRNFYILHEKGEDLGQVEIEADPIFVLGDHIGLPKKEEEFVQRYSSKKIGVGPESYFSTQSITLVHNELDRSRKNG